MSCVYYRHTRSVPSSYNTTSHQLLISHLVPLALVLVLVLVSIPNLLLNFNEVTSSCNRFFSNLRSWTNFCANKRTKSLSRPSFLTASRRRFNVSASSCLNEFTTSRPSAVSAVFFVLFLLRFLLPPLWLSTLSESEDESEDTELL